MPRRFDSIEAIGIKLNAELPDAFKKSINLFREVLEEFRDDERFSTAKGRVMLTDEYEGKPITWILQVKSTILRSLGGDRHIVISVIGEPESGETKEADACVVKQGNLPIGDYLANFLLFFANEIHTSRIKTLATAAMRVIHKGAMPIRIDQLEIYWHPYYEAVIAVDTPPVVRVATTLGTDPEHLLYIIQRLFRLDPDLELAITRQEMQDIFLDLFEQCDRVDVKRYIVARLDPSAETVSRLQIAREEEHEDERLNRAIDYAINRMNE